MGRVLPMRHLPRLGVGRGMDCRRVRKVGYPGGPGRGCDPGRELL